MHIVRVYYNVEFNIEFTSYTVYKVWHTSLTCVFGIHNKIDKPTKSSRKCPVNVVILYLFTGAEYKIYTFPTRYLRRSKKNVKWLYHKHGSLEYVYRQNKRIQEKGQVIVFTGNCRSRI